MDLGPHADDVMDFADFVLSGGIFRDPRPPLDLDLEIIHDMAEVGNYVHASPNVPEGQSWDWDELFDTAGEPSSRLLESQRGERLGAVLEVKEAINGLVDGAIGDSLRRFLGEEYTQTDIQFIWGTVDSILRYRATHGRTLPFIERLVEIYRLGGHPCGWIGAYPEGRLVACFPRLTARKR